MQKKRWRLANREKFRATQRRSWKKRYASNPAFRLARVLRNRLWTALRRKKGRKSAKTLTLIGCDVQFLMGYLEARFKPGMTWKNYGTVWEIDHRIPCASYDLKDPSHQRSCFHYSNLQPMWKPENNQKHAKLPAPHQAELL